MQDQNTQVRKRRGKAVVAAAEQLIRQEGTNALTLRSLAAHLGVQAPTLYTYFSNLEEIEEAALRGIFGSLPVPDLARPEPLGQQLFEMFMAIRELRLRSPGALTGTPGSAAWHWEIKLVNQLLKTFSEIGVDDFRTLLAYRTLLGLTASDARAEERSADRKAEEALIPTLPESEAGYIQRLFRNVPHWVEQSGAERFRQIFAALVELLLPQVIQYDAQRQPRA